MKYFTLEESAPSEMTLEIIRKIAHTYRVSSNPQLRAYMIQKRK